MAHKNKEKQRAATRERVRRYRERKAAEKALQTGVKPDVTPLSSEVTQQDIDNLPEGCRRRASPMV